MFFVLALAPAIAVGAETPGPQAIALLRNAFNAPTFAYRGHMTVTHWFGSGTKSEDVEVWFKPPNSYRWEFLNPDGRVNRVHVRAGDSEVLHMAGQPTVLQGKATKATPKQISADSEWDLVQKNYQILQVGEGAVAGRKTIVLELSPRAAGKPKQQFWIDPDSGVILAIKRFREGGHLAIYSRFTEFQQGPEISDDRFATTSSSEAATEKHGYDQEFKSLAEFEKQSGNKSRLPAVLPMGFEFESVDTFKSDSFTVHHFRYTDGMNVVSIFETTKPSKFASPSTRTLPASPVGPFQITDTGYVFQKKVGDRYFTLISDVSQESLKTIGLALK